jgi:DNA repair protein RecN (Recombination protein N)
VLTHLHIKHFAIIDSSELELHSGMTALTGETGAGKSIMLDALGLVLGARASSDSIQQGAKRADISATFSLELLPEVQQWLIQHELDNTEIDETPSDECLVRRTLDVSGKSRATINDIPVSVQTLRSLGQHLVTIHGQHAYQTMTKASDQRQLLDNFAGGKQLGKVKQAYDAWRLAHDALANSEDNAHAQAQRLDLLSFQLQEFDELDSGATSIADIESEHRWRASSERIMSLSQDTLQAIDDKAYPALMDALPHLTELVQIDERLREALDLVESASIQIAETTQLVSASISRLEHDDNRLDWLDQKLAALHRLAKKHQCEMLELPDRELALRNEHDAITAPEHDTQKLQLECDALRSIYDTEAAKLSRHRKTSAKKLCKKITLAMQGLNMSGGVFDIEIKSDATSPQSFGADSINFLVSPNPGVEPATLSKVASGGELSRISLCMQLATLDTRSVPTLIFDEVDSGVGGAVAEKVGQLLRTVGTNAQVLCVTHLPQVASQAHNHLLISKSVEKGKTRTAVQPLDKKQTRDEIARMLGGSKITAKTRNHAQEMLDSAASAS